jgi:AraC-like DNA-binding protein
MEDIFKLKNMPYYYEETDLRDWGNQPHRSEGGCVFLCVSGTAVFTAGLVECNISTNMETILLPGTTFKIADISENFRVKMFVFSKEIYEQTVQRLGISFAKYLTATVSYSLRNRIDFVQNAELYMRMAELIHREKNNDFVQIMEQNFVQNYFLYLYDKCQWYFEQTENKYTLKQKHFYDFLSLLDRHIRSEKNVSFYAGKLYITPKYLGKITSEITSETSKDLIDKRLVLEIKVLLQHSELTVQQIADDLHFPDQSYLSRYFKHHTGLSPKEYRGQIRN